MRILKIIDDVAYAWKPRHHQLRVLSNSLRSHVPRQCNYATSGLHMDGVSGAGRILVSG
jgi:hypothetical protein